MASDLARLAIAGMMTAGLAAVPVAGGHLAAAEGDTPAAATMVHECAGNNACKGLGGCKVTQEKLAKLAKKRGIPVEEAGSPHECAGRNECKGLGGCSVTAEKFVKLSVVQAEKEGYHKVHDCAGLNVCKGLGGCKVTQEKLAKLAKKRGTPVDEAGSPHECAGRNECKGLGGCSVSEEKYVKLKKKAIAAVAAAQ